MKTLVIDANIVLSQAFELPYSEQAAEFLQASRRDQDRLVVPALWWYEIISGLRRAVTLGILTREQALEALDQFALIRLEAMPPSLELNRLALEWAERIAQSKAYDAQYLALAEHFQAEFWTADERLVNSLKQVGITWTHRIGE